MEKRCEDAQWMVVAQDRVDWQSSLLPFEF
jgi:hypothetical protein